MIKFDYTLNQQIVKAFRVNRLTFELDHFMILSNGKNVYIVAGENTVEETFI